MGRIMSVLFRLMLHTMVLRSSSPWASRWTILALVIAQGTELILDLVSERNIDVSENLQICVYG